MAPSGAGGTANSRSASGQAPTAPWPSSRPSWAGRGSRSPALHLGGALFGSQRVTAAKAAGVHPVLFAAANSSGGALGKMIAPQNLAIGAAATAMAGSEGEVFRRGLGWSPAMPLVMCVLVYPQASTALS
nr:L-lactate permease [Actinacidiphila oryziradicis]